MTRHSRLAPIAGLAAAALTALVGTGTAAAQERGEIEPVSGDIVIEEGLELRGTLDEEPFDVWANVLGLKPHGGEEVLRVYCIDIRTDLDQKSPYTEGEWEESGVANLEKVRWVLTNGHPNAAPERLFTESGIQPAESWDEIEAARVAYAGTQAAVWHFTDGFDLDLEAAVIGGTEEQIDGVAAVYEYLTGSAGRLPDPSEFYIELDGVEEATYEDGRFGPYTVRSGAGTVELSAEGGRLVDSSGAEVERRDDGGDFYIVLDEGSKEITIGGRATYDLPVGRVFMATTAESLSADAVDPVTSDASQQLILAEPRQSEVPAEWGFALRLPEADRPTEEAAQPKLPTTGANLTMGFAAGLALFVGGITVLALARRKTAAE